VQLKLQLLPTGQPTVLLEVEPRRPGGHRLRLHSGVRLVNATDLHLRIGCVPKSHRSDQRPRAKPTGRIREEKSTMLSAQNMLVKPISSYLRIVRRLSHMCCIRWRHPLAPDVSLIQTLAPGAELAVPVANAREGELCLQPAGMTRLR